MKKLSFILAVLLLSGSLMAQGNSGKNKDKDKDKGKNSTVPGNTGNNGNNQSSKNQDYDLKVWEGIAGAGSNCMKPSKNQPAKVRAAFQRDYPAATFVRWSKCRGDWTASFNHGLFRSTAVYHANGDRRDTRSFVVRESIPVKILDVILKRFPNNNIEGGIKIQVPNIVNDIFRIKSIVEGKAGYLYFDTNGSEVQYNY